MRQLFTLVLLCTAMSLSAQWNYGGGSGKKIKGNGDTQIEVRDLDGFNGVSTCCNINVELRQGPFEVKVEAESNLLEYVRTEVSGRRLEIGFKDRANINSNERITVYVSLPELDYLSASSSGEIVSKTNFTGDELELDVSSGALIRMSFTGDEIDADASSGGRMEISGSGGSVRADASSGGSVRAGEFVARRARCGSSSGGGVVVNITEKLDADASSGGRVRYVGNPSTIDSATSSGGSVRRQN
jgi:hypothetical protein